MQLGLSDIVALTRFNRTRNAARNGGGSGGGGYSKKGGPDQKATGENRPADGAGLPARLWYVFANGTVATALFQSTSPGGPPPDAIYQNPS